MNKNHIYIGAAIAGALLGWFYLGTSATDSSTGTPGTFDSIYNAGVSAAGGSATGV